MTFCQPCKEQGKNEPATHWCLQCQELFCMACTDYHKVLKLTRDHRIITYKEYDHVLDVLPLLQTSCKAHSDKDFKYLCKSHDTLCCGTCKIINHSNCEIEKLEAIAIRDNVAKAIEEVLFAPLEHRLRTILDIRRETSDTLKQVDCLRELVIDINQKKKQIYELLNSLDEILTNSLNEYDIEKQHLQLYEDDLSKRHTQIRTKRDKLISLLQLFGTNSVYRLILQIHIKQHIQTDEILESKQLATVKNTDSASRKILNIDELRACLELFDRISNRLALMTSSHDFDLNENSSSTVEVEKEVVNIGYANNADGLVSSAATKSNNSSNFKVTSNQSNPQVTTVATKSPVERITFQFQSNFKIEKKKPNIAIRCAKVLPFGHIIIGESSEPRLMIYAKEGYRKCEMKLEYGPESIAIVDSGTIAVTMSTTVLVVNVTNNPYSINLKRRIEMQDDCYGLTYVNYMLVVNCKQSGLKLVSLDGCTKKIFRSVTGVLHICSDLQSNIFSVQRNSECIKVFNLSSESVIDYISHNMCGANGITTDCHGNVFVTCDRSETVYLLQKGSNTSTSILSKRQGIDSPWNLDYDGHSGELVVINNGGKSVYLYKKQLS